MDNIHNKLIQNSMTYLADIATYINTGNSNNILKSYYLTKCRIHEAKELIHLPAKCTNDTVRCPKCCITYSECNPKIHIQPEKHKSKFGRRLVKKQEQKLTQYQRNYMKSIPKESENYLQITCNFCKKEVKKPLRKQSKEVPIVEVIYKQSKKKRKKDKFSGLNASAVLAVVPQIKTNFISLVAPEIKKDKNVKRNNKKTNAKQSIPVKKTVNMKQNEKNKAHKMNKLSNMLSSANPAKKGGLKQFLDSMQ